MSGIIAQNSGRHTGLVKAGSAGGVWNLIKTLTASNTADLSFVDGASDVVLDSTYDEYVFKFHDIHPETDGGDADFSFNLSIDGGSNYNVTKTTTSWYAGQFEDGTTFAGIAYEPAYDLAQGTGFQFLGADLGADNDQSSCGTLNLYDPSSTTFTKHFLSDYQRSISADATFRDFVAGYGNTTSAVDAVQFKMAGGNFNGTISMYGIT